MMPFVLCGISLGTKSIGLSVMNEIELLDWHTKTFKGRWSDYKFKLILQAIETYQRKHSIQIIALRVIPEKKQSPEYKKLLTGVKHLALKLDLPIHLYERKQIRKAFQNIPRPTKKKISAFLTSQYPELKPLHEKENQARNPYHMKAFEAVMVAHIHKAVIHRNFQKR